MPILTIMSKSDNYMFYKEIKERYIINVAVCVGSIAASKATLNLNSELWRLRFTDICFLHKFWL